MLISYFTVNIFCLMIDLHKQFRRKHASRNFDGEHLILSNTLFPLFIINAAGAASYKSQWLIREISIKSIIYSPHMT